MSDALAAYEMVAGAVKLAPFAGELSATEGPWLFGLVTVIVLDALSTTAPLLSVARAFKMYVPVPTPDSEALYGALLSLPTSVVPRKNATLVTLPLGSDAVAEYEMDAGAA